MNNLKLALILTLASSAAIQTSFGQPGLCLASAKASPSRARVLVPRSPSPILDKEYEAYRQQVRGHFLIKDFSWIDQEAAGVRASKERLPGGFWKIRALYAGIETPAAGDGSSDGDWDDVLQLLSEWSQKQPKSVTAKVALASAWKSYGWKARGNGNASTVSDAAFETFHRRLTKAEQFLAEAASLKEKCPHWYVTAIWIGIGQNWDRDALEKVFAAGVKLEPTYYYIYQAKASYLLPRWGGTEGAWERFAEESALNLGGHQGDIVFFTIYSQMLMMHGMSLMNTHQTAVPKLIAGFRSIEKLYGAAPHRLNEACFFASFGNDLKALAEFFNRIGDDFDERVWHSRQTFEIYRNGFRRKEKAAQTQSLDSGKSDAQNPAPKE
jgi:hypothetical protein